MVIVSPTGLEGLVPLKKGDKALYNGKTINIAVVTRGYPNIIQPTLVMSRDTLRMLGEADTGQRVGPLMVEIQDPSRAEIVAAQCLKGRIEPQDVAALAMFLASDDARFITGHEYFVDAGWR